MRCTAECKSCGVTDNVGVNYDLNGVRGNNHFKGDIRHLFSALDRNFEHEDDCPMQVTNWFDFKWDKLAISTETDVAEYVHEESGSTARRVSITGFEDYAATVSYMDNAVGDGFGPFVKVFEREMA